MMVDVVINYLAVLGAAVASMIIGALWYSPLLFGKLWMTLSGFTEEKLAEAKKKGMGTSYAVAFAGTLLMSYVLAHFIDYVQATTIVGGLQGGFWIWLGFIVPVLLSSVLWEGKSVKLYMLNIAYYAVTLMAMSVILAVWV